jgi:hypothetical protein
MALESDDRRRGDPPPLPRCAAPQAILAPLAPVQLAILKAANTNAVGDIRGKCAHATGPNRLIT